MKAKMIMMACFAMFVLGANAQQRQRLTPEQREARRVEMVAKQAEQLAKEFDLKKEAKDAFVATYKDMQSALQAAQGQTDVREDRNKDFSTEEAADLLNARFDRDQKRAQIMKEYVVKFSSMLNGKQLLRVFRSNDGNARQRTNNGRPNMGQRPNGYGNGFGGGFNDNE